MGVFSSFPGLGTPRDCSALNLSLLSGVHSPYIAKKNPLVAGDNFTSLQVDSQQKYMQKETGYGTNSCALVVTRTGSEWMCPKQGHKRTSQKEKLYSFYHLFFMLVFFYVI